MTAQYERPRRKSTNTCARIAAPRSLPTRDLRRSSLSLCIIRMLNGDSEGPQSRDDVYRFESVLVLLRSTSRRLWEERVADRLPFRHRSERGRSVGDLSGKLGVDKLQAPSNRCGVCQQERLPRGTTRSILPLTVAYEWSKKSSME